MPCVNINPAPCPDAFAPLKYDTATIEAHLKQGHKQFPVVVNMVVYHGNKPWNYSTAFADYYENPELGAQNLYMAPTLSSAVLSLQLRTLSMLHYTQHDQGRAHATIAA